MSWRSCKQCMFLPKSSFSSALFKVLLTLKLLHGSRSGSRGSTLEDIAMYMMKHFSLDGDVKSQVLASLKYGVKLHFIEKNKDKFSLILPGASIHLAPSIYKEEEIERIQCIYPAIWSANCPTKDGESCCGKRSQKDAGICCEDSDNDRKEESACSCKRKARGSQSSCSVCGSSPSKRKRMAPCPKSMAPVCSRMRKKNGSCGNPYDNPCLLCENTDDATDIPQYHAFKNCNCCQK